jgi:hypothetical protein
MSTFWKSLYWQKRAIRRGGKRLFTPFVQVKRVASGNSPTELRVIKND